MDWQIIITILGTTTAPLLVMMIFLLNKVDQNGKAISRLDGKLEGYITGIEHSHIAGAKHSRTEKVKKSRVAG